MNTFKQYLKEKVNYMTLNQLKKQLKNDYGSKASSLKIVKIKGGVSIQTPGGQELERYNNVPKLGYTVVEADGCWQGFKKVGMKKKGDKLVPNCVPESIEEETSCPRAAGDVELNTKNRDMTIEKYMYGPLNVKEPGNYWEKVAKKWDTTVAAAKKSLCENCVAFDISPRMKDCMPGKTSDGDGELGYCWMHHFKCHSARTCTTWAKGGPIKDDKTSEQWQEKSGIKEGKGKPESWEAGFERRVVKTTDPDHKEKGYEWRIKGKDRPEVTIKLYRSKPSFAEFKKQMKRVAGHEFGG